MIIDNDTELMKQGLTIYKNDDAMERKTYAANSNLNQQHPPRNLLAQHANGKMRSARILFGGSEGYE